MGHGERQKGEGKKNERKKRKEKKGEIEKENGKGVLAVLFIGHC